MIEWPNRDIASLLFRGLKRIATNRASYLEIDRNSNLKVVALFPLDCRAERTRIFPGTLPFAAGNEVGEGRILVLSDHSVFVNGLMLQNDTDNFDFAYNCVRWLIENGRRNRVMLVDEGNIVPDFHVPLKNPDIPTPTVEIVNKLIAGLEEDNFFNNLILGQASLRRVESVLALLVTLGLVVAGLFRLRGGKHSIEPSVVNLEAAAGAATRLDDIVDQRHETMIRQGNLYAAAQELARQWFASCGVGAMTEISAPPRRRQRRLAGTPSPSEGRSPVIALAVDERPVRVTAREFEQLLQQADQTKRALRQGRLHLDFPEDRT